MLCSRCSAPVRPIVAIDIDGTLADYHTHLIEFATMWLGHGPEEGGDTTLNGISYEPYTGEGPYSDWFMTAFGVEHEVFRQVKLAYRQGGMKRVQPVYDNSARMVNGLRDYGVEVWLTTTRPHDRFDRVDPDTREWIYRNGITFDALLYHGEKLKELAERVSPDRVVAVLDDQEDILIEAETVLPSATGILRRTQYNSAVEWDPAVEFLSDAYHTMKTLVDEWRRENG